MRKVDRMALGSLSLAVYSLLRSISCHIPPYPPLPRDPCTGTVGLLLTTLVSSLRFPLHVPLGAATRSVRERREGDNQGSVCKVGTQDPENLDEELKPLVTVWSVHLSVPSTPSSSRPEGTGPGPGPEDGTCKGNERRTEGTR